MTERPDGRRPRVLVVGRYFWPLGCFDQAVHLMSLTNGLHESGMHVEVLTPKYHTDWADQFRFRDVAVHRPFRPPRTAWKKPFDRGTNRYVESLTQWILHHGKHFDLLYCDSAREESLAVMTAATALGIRSIVRVSGRGTASDIEWMKHSRYGKRVFQAASDASAIVVADASSERKWYANGGDSAKLIRICPGVFPSEPLGQQELRASLSRINRDFFVPQEHQVLLSIERHEQESGIRAIANAANSLSIELPRLQYWLVGDGQNREAIYSKLRSDGLRQSIAMPGSFGRVDDIFYAADLIVHAGDDGFDALIPSAVEAGLPLVLADSEAARSCFNTRSADLQTRMIRRKETG
ncbi:MAG: glycosyltransferase, partial [Planctomycetota bacterium]